MRRGPTATVLACALATSACALAIAGTDARAGDRKNVARCVSYSQSTKETSIEVRLTSTCDIDLECSVSWTLTCGGSRDRHRSAKVLSLVAGATEVVHARATRCGDQGWSIRAIKWTCRSQAD